MGARRVWNPASHSCKPECFTTEVSHNHYAMELTYFLSLCYGEPRPSAGLDIVFIFPIDSCRVRVFGLKGTERIELRAMFLPCWFLFKRSSTFSTNAFPFLSYILYEGKSDVENRVTANNI